MNPGRYFMPNMGMRFMMPMSMPNNYLMPGRTGLISRITQGIRSFNWGGLLSGANKTLNVVNQTIPLIKQARPMFGNMRSMLQLARAFKSETNNNIVNKKISNFGEKYVRSNSINTKKEVINNNYPNFFI